MFSLSLSLEAKNTESEISLVKVNMLKVHLQFLVNRGEATVEGREMTVGYVHVLLSANLTHAAHEKWHSIREGESERREGDVHKPAESKGSLSSILLGV